MALQTLENEFWQVGVLPETGSSTAFGRTRRGDHWLDVMRPTAESDYGNTSLCSSFIMLPWCNRLRDAHFRFSGKDYPLEVSSGDGTAIHGAVRHLPWQVESSSKTHLVTTFDSSQYEKVNYPFKFSARAEFGLLGRDFVMGLTLKNEDTQLIPAGFGHHPYFVRDQANSVQVEIPAAARFELVRSLVEAPSVPLTPETDFRTLHSIRLTYFEAVYTERSSEVAARVVYPEVALTMLADPLFKHVLLFAPDGKPYFAVEPMSNVNDGFNLYDQGIEGTGVFILQPGESKSGTVTLRMEES